MLDLERATLDVVLDETDVDNATEVVLNIIVEIPGDYTPQAQTDLAANWRQIVSLRLTQHRTSTILWDGDAETYETEDGEWLLPSLADIMTILAEEAWEWCSGRRKTAHRPAAPPRWVLELSLPLQAVADEPM